MWSHNWKCIYSHFWDNAPQTYWVHDLAWPCKVTWCHRSRDHSIRHVPFPIVVPLEPNLYLRPLVRYPNICVSRPWPFRVTWRHLSCDHLITQVPFPIGAQVTESLSKAIIEITGPKHIGVTTLTLQACKVIMRRHRSRDQSIRHMPAISYWCPIGTEPQSLTLFEIFGTKNRVHTETQTDRQYTDTSDYIFFATQCIASETKNRA